MALFPTTAKKLDGKGKRVLAALSIASFGTFIGLLPITIITPTSLELFWFLVGIGYVVVFLIIAPVFTSATKLLGIEKSLFNDYAAWSSLFHLGLMIASLSAIIIVAMAKILVFYKDLRYNSK